MTKGSASTVNSKPATATSYRRQSHRQNREEREREGGEKEEEREGRERRSRKRKEKKKKMKWIRVGRFVVAVSNESFIKSVMK